MSLVRQIRGMPPEQRFAGGAAALLALTMILPWYEKSYFATQGRRPVALNDSMNAFQVFTFVEAAVLVVAAGVLYLVWARAQRKGFHLPFGDGVVISAAGAWAGLLLVWRLFDKPDVSDPGATVGIQWGIFAALIAAGALAAAGARVRAAHRPEPPNPAEEMDWEEPRRDRTAPRTRTEPRDPTAVTEALGDRPAWEGEPPPDPHRAAGRARSGEPADRDDAGERPDRLF